MIGARMRRAASGLLTTDPPAPGGMPLGIDWHTAFWAEGDNMAAQNYTNDDQVPTWPDETVNGRDATQATSSQQPLYKASVAALNSKPAVKGDGSNDKLRTAAFAATVANPFTIVTVGHVTSVGEHLHDGLTSGDRAVLSATSTSNGWQIYNGAGVVGGTHDSSAHLFVVTFTGTDTLEVDGTEVASGDAGSHALTGINLFSNFTTTSSAFNSGHIAFLGLKEGTLTSEEKSDLLAWSRSHYVTP